MGVWETIQDDAFKVDEEEMVRNQGVMLMRSREKEGA